MLDEKDLNMNDNLHFDCVEKPMEPDTVEYYETLISSFSHDFRGRLASLLLNIHLLEKQPELESDEKLHQLKTAIMELNDMVSDMRNASHPCDHDQPPASSSQPA